MHLVIIKKKFAELVLEQYYSLLYYAKNSVIVLCTPCIDCRQELLIAYSFNSRPAMMCGLETVVWKDGGWYGQD